MNNDTASTSLPIGLPTLTHPHFNLPLMAKLCKRRGGEAPSTTTREPNGVMSTLSGTKYAPYQSGWRKIEEVKS